MDLFLDRCGFFKPHGIQCFHQVRVKLQFREFHILLAKDIFREGTVLKMGRLIAALGIADALDKQHYRLSM
jgi:hypothetical protein